MSALPMFRRAVRMSGPLALLALCLSATAARAEMLMLSQTTLVSGTESSVDSFTIASDGTLTLQLSDISWPQALTSLNFMLSSADQVMGAWSAQQNSIVESIQLTPGTYYGHITGTAGGDLDLGVYSVTVGFQPAGVVPLPASGRLLLVALLALLGLAWPLGKARPASGAAAADAAADAAQPGASAAAARRAGAPAAS